MKTSTFTIHHDRCDPSKWTPGDVLVLAKFIQTGSLQYAATLSRLGVQLVTSEHHEPKGGTLEEIGWMQAGDESVYDLEDIVQDDITSLHRIYRGPEEHIVKVGIGDGEGNLDGYEYEIKPTLEEAKRFLEGVYSNVA